MDKISASVLLKGLAPEGFADEAAIDLVTTDSREVRPGASLWRSPVKNLTATISRPKHWKKGPNMSSSTTR